MKGALVWLRRRGWIALGVLLVAVGGVYLRGGDTEEVSWESVVRQDLALKVDMSGELKAVQATTYGPPPMRNVWDFRISFMAPEGATAEEGQPILGFDTTELEQRLLRRTAERDSADKSLERKETDLKVEMRRELLALAEAEARVRKAVLKTDVPEGVIASQELRKAMIDREIAEAELQYRKARLDYLGRTRDADLGKYRRRRDRAKRRVEELERDIAIMTVRATQSGTVIYSTHRNREKKKVGDRCWRNERVMEIPDLSRMLAEVDVDESELSRLSVGQRSQLRLDAHPDTTYVATVARIHNTVEQRSWRDPRKRVRLELDLERTDTQRMRPAMRVTGTIEVERIEDVLTVPLAAVQPGPDGPSAVVRKVFGRRQVWPRLGRRNDAWVEVLSGLEQGDRVLRNGQH